MEEKIPGSEHEIMSDPEYQRLGERLSERIERFPFPELTPTAYAKLKAESEEFPDFFTDIDILVTLFRKWGAKIVVAENGNCFVMPYILPVNRDTLDNYTVRPRTLEVTADMDPDLQKLILARR